MDLPADSTKPPAPHLSIVSPVYQGEGIIDLLVARITKAVSAITDQYEIVLVEDHSPDRSWEEIRANCRRDAHVKGLKLSRNFGQHSAITAGLDHCRGEWVVVMDCDLQDRPEEIEKLYQEAQKGFDIVLAHRISRRDTFLKKLYSKFFYRVLRYLTGTEQDGNAANFGIYHRKVIDVLKRDMREYFRYFPTMIHWLGFRATGIEVAHAERLHGETSYSFGKLLNLALNIILSFSDKPLRLTVRFGLFIAVAALLFSVFNVILYFTGGIDLPGWASLITSIWFLAGVIITIMGMLGLYIGRIFEQVKGRPIYIVEQSLNVDDAS